MTFITLEGIENVQERPTLPEAQVDFVIDDVKGEERDDKAYSIRCRCTPEGTYDGYEAVFHYLTTPGPEDDEDKRRFKMLMIKRFCHLVGVSLSEGGFSEEDLMGARFTARCSHEEYEGRETVRLVVPKLPTEQ